MYLKRSGASDPLDLEIQEVVSGDISSFSSHSYLVQECFCYGFLACTLILCITQSMIAEASKLSAREGTTELRDSAREWMDACCSFVSSPLCEEGKITIKSQVEELHVLTFPLFAILSAVKTCAKDRFLK